MPILSSSSETGCSMRPEKAGAGATRPVGRATGSVRRGLSARAEVAGRSLSSCVLGIVLLLAGPPATHAQPTQTVDSGRFQIRSGGDVVASESFAIRREASSIQSVARSSPVPERAGERPTLEYRMQTSPAYEPAFFELRFRDGDLETAVGVRSGSRIKVTKRTPEGERWREFRLLPGLVILPEGLAHSYYFVLQTLEQRPGRELPVLHPFQGEQGSLTVTDRTRETLRIDGEERQAARLSLRLGGETHTVWVDDQGRILRVEIPSRKWSAQRLPDQGEGATPDF